jgi:sulfide:quinone oxidoreductase
VAAPRVLILGGGFGGLSAAHALKQAAPEADVSLVDRSPEFVMGLRKLWMLDGRSATGEGTRPRTLLDHFGIRYLQGSVDSIDPGARRVVVDGNDLACDFLIVGLGAEGRPDLIPGQLDGNPNLYTFEGAAEAASRIKETRAGRIVIVIAGVPIKCPPAPYEAALIIDALLRDTQRRNDVHIEVITPQPMSIPAAGVVACNSVESQLADRDIGFRPKAKIERIEPGNVVIEGETVTAELLIVVPPHRPPQVVANSGLAQDTPWVEVNPETLATSFDGVYAIGDVTEMKTGAGLPFPKAGVFAERHGEVVAANIAAQITGAAASSAFDGSGFCFLEAGGGKAARVEGNFRANPPSVEIGEPSEANMEAKRQFEQERLARWLPADSF